MPRTQRSTSDGRKFMTPEQIQKITHALWMMAQLLSEEDFKKVKPYMEEIDETLKEAAND